MSNGNFLFTSESVTEGHPDKIADHISDAILDAILAQDPMGRVACETLVTTGLAVVAGEITTTADINYKRIIRETIDEIGYEAREAFKHAGGEQLQRCPCLNDHPAWIAAMRDIILQEGQGWIG